MRVCQHCHRVPVTGNALRMYCSHACKVMAYHARLKALGQETVTAGTHQQTCAQCGETFQSVRARRLYCSRSCNKKALRLRASQADTQPSVSRVGRPKAPPQILDLTDAQIEARLAALAARRRQTRSWLRIEDPWQQRAGSALHQTTAVDGYDWMEGAYQ